MKYVLNHYWKNKLIWGSYIFSFAVLIIVLTVGLLPKFVNSVDIKENHSNYNFSKKMIHYYSLISMTTAIVLVVFTGISNTVLFSIENTSGTTLTFFTKKGGRKRYYSLRYFASWINLQIFLTFFIIVKIITVEIVIKEQEFANKLILSTLWEWLIWFIVLFVFNSIALFVSSLTTTKVSLGIMILISFVFPVFAGVSDGLYKSSYKPWIKSNFKGNSVLSNTNRIINNDSLPEIKDFNQRDFYIKNTQGIQLYKKRDDDSGFDYVSSWVFLNQYKYLVNLYSFTFNGFTEPWDARQIIQDHGGSYASFVLKQNVVGDFKESDIENNLFLNSIPLWSQTRDVMNKFHINDKDIHKLMNELIKYYSSITSQNTQYTMLNWVDLFNNSGELDIVNELYKKYQKKLDEKFNTVKPMFLANAFANLLTSDISEINSPEMNIFIKKVEEKIISLREAGEDANHLDINKILSETYPGLGVTWPDTKSTYEVFEKLMLLQYASSLPVKEFVPYRDNINIYNFMSKQKWMEHFFYYILNKNDLDTERWYKEFRTTLFTGNTTGVPSFDISNTDLIEVFHQYDTNDDKLISWDETKKALSQEGIKKVNISWILPVWSSTLVWILLALLFNVLFIVCALRRNIR